MGEVGTLGNIINVGIADSLLSPTVPSLNANGPPVDTRRGTNMCVMSLPASRRQHHSRVCGLRLLLCAGVFLDMRIVHINVHWIHRVNCKSTRLIT